MIGLFVSGTWLEKGLQAFTYMLLHSLWQGLLLAVVTGCLLSLAKKMTPAARYTLMCGLVLAFLVVCTGTFVYGWHQAAAPVTVAGGIAETGTNGVLIHYGLGHWIARMAAFCTKHNDIIIGTWLTVFLVRCWGILRAVRYMEIVKAKELHAVNELWGNRLHVLAGRLGIGQAVGLFESGITRIPVVMGHLKPVIYVPLGMLSSLPPDQVEAILLHELAHIRRYDYFANLVQCIAEAMFFFNPGLLWVSSLIKEEREHCCDDVVLAHTDNKKQFIEALIGFKEQAMHRQSLTLAFPGRKSQLVQRVSRIVYDRNNPFSSLEKGFLVISFAVCLLLLISLVDKKGTGAKGLGLAQEALSLQPALRTGRSVADTTARLRLAAQKTTGQAAVQPALVDANGRSARRFVPTEVNDPSSRRSTPIDVKGPLPVNGQSFHQQATAMAKLTAEKQAAEQLLRMQQDAARQEAQRILQAQAAYEQAIDQRNEADDLRKQLKDDQDAALLQKQLAEKSRAQAEVRRKLAEDRRLQAEKDREQAARMREKAAVDKQAAEQLRQRAEKERLLAEDARQQADRYREAAERERLHAEKERAHVEQQRHLINSTQPTDQPTPLARH